MNYNTKVFQVLQTKGLYNVLTNSVLGWMAFKGVCIQTLIGHLSSVTSVIELKNGNLASASDDGTIKIWKAGVCIQTLIGHNNHIHAVIELNNGKLASASGDQTIKIWKDGVCLQTLKGHTGYVRSLIELKNGNIT